MKINKIVSMQSRIVLFVPTPPTIPPIFNIYTYIHTFTHTLKVTHWLPRHTPRRLLSTTLRATSEGSMAKVGLAIADKSGLTRGVDGALPYYRRLAASFGLGDSPTPRLLNHETEQRGPCRGEQRRGSQRVN